MRAFTLQWGSEIQPSLDFKWSKRGWVANGLNFKWDLKSRQMAAILSKTNSIVLSNTLDDCNLMLFTLRLGRVLKKRTIGCQGLAYFWHRWSKNI